MNKYEKLISILDEKLTYSEEFLNLTEQLKSQISSDDFDSLESILKSRNEIIQSVDLIDEQFVSLYKELSESENFEDELKNYTKLSQNIIDIKNNFQNIKLLDAEIMPLIKKQHSQISSKLKDLNIKEKVTNKYGQDTVNKVTMDNYGIFFDEKK